MIELLVLRDGREVDRYVLSNGKTVLGRADDCDLLLDDAAVSRRHARITVEAGRVFVADMGSGNGTWVEGTRVKDAELVDGAEFRIEPFQLRIAISPTNAAAGVAATRPVDSSQHGPSSIIEPSASPLPRQPGGTAALGARLEPVRGGGGPILLGRGELVIGRSDDVAVALRDGSVSRRHAKLHWMDDRYALEDLASANGTFVNDTRLAEPRFLKDGDRLRFGDSELLFVDPASATLSSESIPPVPTKPVSLEPSTSQAMVVVEQTSAGDPPPAAFLEDEPIAEPAFDAPPVYEETDAGGLVELYDDGPAPDEGRRKKRLLAAAAAAILASVIGFAYLASLTPGERTEPEPDRVQRTLLQTMDRLTKEAEGYLAPERRDLPKALELYGKLYTFSLKDELRPFARARDLERLATERTRQLHEAILAQKLAREIEERAKLDGETKAKVDEKLRVANAGVTEGRAGRMAGFDRAIKALEDALAIAPGHADASRLLAQVRPERVELAKRIAIANRDRIERLCSTWFNAARARGTNPDGLKAAVALYEKILDEDETRITTWPAAADAEKARALRRLGEVVAPLRESARNAMKTSDYRGARTFLRKAIGTNPFDPEIRKELDAAQYECEQSARKHIQSAKAYKGAFNFQEALKELDAAQSFVDRETDKLWKQAEELRKEILRSLVR